MRSLFLLLLPVVATAATLTQPLDDFAAGVADGAPLGWQALGIGAEAKLTWLSQKPGALRIAYKFESPTGRLLVFRSARLRGRPVSLEATVRGDGERLGVLLHDAVDDELFEYPGGEPVKGGGWNTFLFSLKTPTATSGPPGNGKLDLLPGGGGLSLRAVVVKPGKAGLSGTVDLRELNAAVDVRDDQAAMVDLVGTRWDGIYAPGAPPQVQVLASTVSEAAGKYQLAYSVTDADGRPAGKGEQAVELRSGDLLRVPVAFAPAQPLGHFTVRASLEGAASKRYATARFVVTPETPAGPGRRLGAHVVPTFGPLRETDDLLVCQALRRAGAGYARFDLRWAATEREPGKYDWKVLDYWLGLAKATGLPLVAVVWDPPAWLAGRSPADEGLLAGFVAAAAARAGKLVAAYEVWKQPNWLRFWPPDPQPYGYRQLLADTAARLATVDGKPLVVNGGLRGFDKGFAGVLLGADGAVTERLVLALSVPRNAFPFVEGHQAPSRELLAGFTAARQWLREGGRRELGLWAVDVGVRSSPVEESKIGQARELARCAATALGFGGAMFWHRALDGDEKTDRFGLLRGDLEPKPAYAAYAAAAAAAYGAIRLGPARAAGNAWVLRSKDNTLVIVWSDKEHALPALDGVTVRDMWGNEVPAAQAKIGPTPLYLTGAGVLKAFPL